MKHDGHATRRGTTPLRKKTALASSPVTRLPAMLHPQR